MDDFQRQVATVALSGGREHSAALAGSGAIQAHGLADRPTRDVDLFLDSRKPAAGFDPAVDAVRSALTRVGYDVTELRRAEQYGQFLVSDGQQTVELDLAIDWRARDPVQLDVGPVLHIEDAVGSKVGALYSRAEPRDFADVDAIRRSGRFSDEQLLSLAEHRDPGFDRTMFADQLRGVSRIQPGQMAPYAIDAERLRGIQDRSVGWATKIITSQQSKEARPASRPSGFPGFIGPEAGRTEDDHGLSF